MFSLFRRDPIKKLEAEYRRCLREAGDLQRSGDIRAATSAIARAEEVALKVEALRIESL